MICLQVNLKTKMSVFGKEDTQFYQGNIEIGSYEVGAVQNFILQMTINAHPLSILL
jgi:hypothetical protein